MRVLFDYSPAYSTFGGNRTYCVELLKALGGTNQRLHVNAYAYRPSFNKIGKVAKSFASLYRDFIAYNFARPIREHGYDLLHSTGMPVFGGCSNVPHVITLHDMAPLDTPWRYSLWHRVYFCTIYRDALYNADAILCNSQFTKRRLGHYWPALLGRAYVTPLAARTFHNKVNGNSLKLPPEYLLAVASFDVGKNLSLITDSIRLANMMGMPLPPVVHIGSSKVSGASGPVKGLVTLGGLSDDEMYHVYRNAALLLFPSLYEGFGLPVVEAMAAGTPVIALPTPAVVEVGGAAITYCGNSAESLLSAIRTLLADHKKRDVCINAGYAQARRFSWADCANKTFEVYEQVVNR